MNNDFVKQFGENINFFYTCFDRVVMRGYIKKLFWESGLVLFLRALGFKQLSNGVMRIFTDQLNSHIKKESERTGIPILWWPSVGGGKNGDKHRYVEKHYVKDCQPKGNFVYCVITDTETAMSFASRELKTRKDKSYRQVYKCKKLVKHYDIYCHDQFLGGPATLRYLPICPFHVNSTSMGIMASKSNWIKEGFPTG